MTTSVSPRWQLHRGGIVNVWQYAEQTFDFSGGRAIRSLLRIASTSCCCKAARTSAAWFVFIRPP